MKRFLAVVLTLCTVIPLLVAAIPAAAASTAMQGVRFNANEMYYVEGTLKEVPHTFETWIYVPSDLGAYQFHPNDARVGSLLSNYSGFPVMPYLHLSIETAAEGYYPKLEWKELYDTNDNNNGYNTSDTSSAAKNEIRVAAFKQAIIAADTWVHVAITVDARTSSLTCYLNGEAVQTVSNQQFFLGDLDVRLVDLPFVIGNDNRNGQPYYFRGELASLTLYSGTRTAAQIKADYEQGVDTAAEDLLAHWSFAPANGSLPAIVADQSGNGYSLTHNRMWIDAGEDDFAALPEEYAYTMIAVGDTQYMMQHDANNGTSYGNTVYAWIADRADELNLQIVMGLGDITNSDTEAQWTVVQSAFANLNGVVPYTLVRGNHDLLKGGSLFDQIFAADTDATNEYIDQFKNGSGGLMTAGSVANTYYTFKANGTDWMVVNLDWAPTDEMLHWAELIIATHPDHKVIVNTHCYIHLDATTCDKEDTSSIMTEAQNYGDQIWDKLIYNNENVVMVLSGHQESNLVTMTQTLGKHGNTVSQFLIDPQAVDTHTINTEGTPSGIITIFYFDKDGRTVNVRHYSPIRDQYYLDRNQFSFDLEADVSLQNTGWNGHAITPAGSGTEEDPYIVENAGNLVWMSKQISERLYYDYNDYEGGYFNGVYFKQVCDIDLNRLAICTIGYNYTTEWKKNGYNANFMAAFGGHYDGGGYRIHNGRIISQPDIGYNDNYSWATALFGCIYGATIENVTLDNVTIYSDGVTGGIVGRAAAPADGRAPADFNVISNCHVTSSCDIVARFPCGKTLRPDKLAYDTIFQFGTVGGVCGMALATTIENCTADVEFTVDGHHALVGGIVGTAGYNTVIDHCAFTGGVSLVDNVSIIEQTFGGIVGLITPNAETEIYANVGNIDLIGTVRITNCYNTGYLNYTGTRPYAQETRWGGILGHAPTLPNLPYEQAPFLIENCHNLSYLSGAEGDWVGGIVAKVTMDEKNSALTVRSCSSVPVGAKGGSGTNEYRLASEGAVLANATATAEATTIVKSASKIAETIARAGNTEPNKWLIGEGAPTESANAGDMYLDTLTGEVYQYVTEWTLVTVIKGADGKDGADGKNGVDGKDGADGKDGIDGITPTVEIVNGFWYINGTNTTVKAEGLDGADGATPSVEIVDGYWYINGTNTTVKAEGLDGAAGAQGPQGEQGEQGAIGATGAQGEKGDKGDNGAPAETSSAGTVALIIAIAVLAANGVFLTLYLIGKRKKA